jgi:hypothetical protein
MAATVRETAAIFILKERHTRFDFFLPAVIGVWCTIQLGNVRSAVPGASRKAIDLGKREILIKELRTAGRIIGRVGYANLPERGGLELPSQVNYLADHPKCSNQFINNLKASHYLSILLSPFSINS